MSTIRVFVNGTGIEVAPDATAVEAVAVIDRAEAEGVLSGRRLITDSRGLAVPPRSSVFAGAIFRTVRAKASAGEAE